MKETQELKMLSFNLWEQYQVDPGNRERSWNDIGIKIIHISLWRHDHYQTGHNNMSSMTPAKRHKPCSHYCLRADCAESLRPSLDPYSPILSIFLEPYHEPWRIRAGEFHISKYQALKNKMKSLYQTKWGRCTWQRYFFMLKYYTAKCSCQIVV